ncbi:MAG TPA: TIGR04219 family outer membrane beta-barrel protein [Gammaproteobacteria bacterium]|nr:TIGR04219 family outer membrane beta-barrel protein [Gammaproteobacteria bacterium]
MKKLLLGAIVALLPLTGFTATVLGIKAGAGTWSHDPSGNITASVNGAGTSADLKDDLQLGKKSEGYVYVAIEHPVPLVPNIKFVSTKLSSSGSGTVTTDFDFNGTTYTASTAVTSSLKLDQTDTILYYEILDNDLVSLDIGLNAKMIDGNATVNTDSASFSATIPMLYAAAEIGLPAGFAVSAEISNISAGANMISDISTKVTYTTDFMLGVEAGIRTQNYNIDVDSVKASMKFTGLFLGVFFNF